MSIVITNPRRLVVFVVSLVLIIGGVVFAFLKWKSAHNPDDPENQEQVYEVLVQVVDEKTKDPAEDARSSIKAGDVLVFFPEGHPWSDTEKTSYLLLKIKLKKKDADKLVQSETKKVKLKKEEVPEGEPGFKEEVVRARAYRIKIEKLDFKANEIWKSQPYPDKVFGAEIIEKNR